MYMYIHYSATCNYDAWKYIDFLPRRISSLTLSVLSCPNRNVDMYVYVHIRILVQVLVEEANTHSGTVGFAPGNYNEPQLFR